MNVLQATYGVLTQATARLRAWFEPPLDEDARPLEIRAAIVEQIEQRIEPREPGRRALRHNRVSVTVLAPEREDRAALQGALADIDDAVRARFAEIRCAVPAGFAIDVRYVRKPKPGWPAGQRLAIDLDSRPVSGGATARGPAPPGLRVTVIRGRSTHRSYTLADGHVCIGRTATPSDHLGRVRHNHVVFVEEGDEHSATVGRAHASITYDGTRREYRLFDDGSHNGTRIIRGGTPLVVPPRSPAGVTIYSGDELCFGTAAVRVEIEGL